MAFFTQDYLDFFQELSENNHKDWFDINRKRYEKSVKIPFNAFVTHMIELIQIEDSTVQVEAKHCLFRINRDIRFSKDKTPYKVHMSAAISRNGRKEMGIPGLYFHLGNNGVGVFGGCYNPEKAMLADIRYYIADNQAEFKKVISNKAFKNKWGELEGAKNKIIHKDLKEPAAEQPLIMNKQFYYAAQIPKPNILDDDLDTQILAYFKASESVRVFLTKAIGAWVEV